MESKRVAILFLIFFTRLSSFSQEITIWGENYQLPNKIEVPDPQCPECSYRLPQDARSISDPNYAYHHHASWCSYYPKAENIQTSAPRPAAVHVPSQNDQIKQMVTGMIMQSLITAVFSTTPQQTEQQQWEAQQAELARLAEIARQKRIQDSIAQVKHDKMMGLFKPLEGAVTTVDFKTLDGEMEQMRSEAGAMFDQGMSLNLAVQDFSQGTNFFGTMLDQDINILFEPDNDPMIVDLREAKAVLADTLTSANLVQDLKKDDPIEHKKPRMSIEECTRLAEKNTRDLENKAKYEATIDRTVVELDKWKEENQSAMVNAFTEGFGFLAGRYKILQEKKRAPAEIAKKTMEEILKKDPKNEAAKNVIEYINKNYLSKNVLEQTLNGYDMYKDIAKYSAVLRDALQNSIQGYAAVDNRLLELLKTPELSPFLNDKAFSDACNFTIESVSDMAINSKIAQSALESVFKAKIPYVSIAQFAVNQSYNATHWYLSHKMILELNAVHGKELETAQYLQNRIFSDQLKLDQNCK